MTGGELTAALDLELEYEDVASEQIVSGAPRTGYATVDAQDAGEIGVWEMTVGAMSDTEVSEVFVVIAGSATVEFIEPALAPLELAPGSVVKLDVGMQTIWTVREPLRKIFIER